MEPPALFQRGGSSLDKSRRDMMLRIDPQLYASTSRAFEELPENFLEISPQQNSTCGEVSLEIGTNHLQVELSSSCLSPGIGEQRFSNENVDILPHLSDQGLNSAGLLVNSVVDELSHESRRYIIKEESPDIYHNSNPCEPIYLPSSYEHEQDDGELCNLHSPISLQNDLVSSVLNANADEHFLPTRQVEPIARQEKTPSPVLDTKEGILPVKNEEETVNYSALNDQLNMNLDDNSYLDTKLLCQQIANELKLHAIPQAVFAERILCRSQGTLSDLLRNPKPWEKLKSGRETFRRMHNWFLMPLNVRLGILDIKKDVDFASYVNNSPPTPAKSSRIRQPSVSDDGLQSKRPRLVFTDVQKRTLQAIFKETQRPSRDMQSTIADHLGLDLSTVSNFFMNARRRSRTGGSIGDDIGMCDQTTPPSKSTSKRRNNTSSSSSSSSNQIHEAVDNVIANFVNKEDSYEEEVKPAYSSRSRRRNEQKMQIKSEESPTSGLLDSHV